MTVEEKRIAEARDYDGLVEAFRIRRNELGLTVDTIDNLGGFARGHAGKLLGEGHVKSFGPISLGLMLQVLALKIVLVEDPESAARMATRWEKRERPAVDAYRVSIALMKRVKTPLMRELAKSATEGRKKIKPATRRRIARHAARSRWQKKR